MSEWPPHMGAGAPPPPGRSGAGVVVAVVAAVALLALVVVLARAFDAAALGLLGGAPTMTNGQALPGTRGPRQVATGTATASADWRAYVNQTFGFRLDLPAALASDHGFFINDASGQGFDMAYNNAPLTTPLQRLQAETVVEVLYSTAITDRDICPDAGAPVTLGAGITGRQQSNAPPLLNGPAADAPYVNASVAQGGVAIRFELRGQPPAETFMARYGDLWRHMLASFAPVSGGPVFTTHPCG